MTDLRNNQGNMSPDEIEIDLKQVFAIFRKWSRLILFMTLFGTVLAAVVSYFVLAPVYQSQTLLMVTQATEKLQTSPTTTSQEGLEEVVGAVSRIPVWTMSTYLGQIKSEALLQRIIDKLELEYTPAQLSGMISAAVVKDSNLIEVKVNNGDPLLAAHIANMLSEQYLEFMTEKNQEQLSRSVDFLEKQKKITDQDLEMAEESLKKFRSQPRGVALLEAEFTSKTQAVVEHDNRLKAAQVEIRQLEMGIASLENELSLTPPQMVVESTDPASGRMSVSQEANPLYLSLAQQVAEKRAALAERLGETESLQYTIDSLNMELDQLQADLAERKLEDEQLTREVEHLQQTSSILAKKTTETQIAKSVDIGDTSIIVVSEASVPSAPIKPNKQLNVALAFVLGFMIFTLLAFVMEYMDNTLKTPEDISQELDLPLVGLIPEINARTVQHNPYGG